MVLVPQSINVEQSVNDIMGQIVAIVEALKAGQSIEQIALGEVTKLGSLIADFSSLGVDVEASFSGTLNAVLVNGVALAASLLGKS